MLPHTLLSSMKGRDRRWGEEVKVGARCRGKRWDESDEQDEREMVDTKPEAKRQSWRKKEQKCQMGEEFSWWSRKADKYKVLVCVILMRKKQTKKHDEHNNKPGGMCFLVFLSQLNRFSLRYTKCKRCSIIFHPDSAWLHFKSKY